MGYTSQSFRHPFLASATLPPSPSPNPPTSTSTSTPHHASPQWFHDFRRLIRATSPSSHETTTLLALLSSSITNASPLPPYLHAPQAYALSARLEAVDAEILSLKHIAEPGYAAFAVMAVCSRCVHMDVERLLVVVKKLVGELDFSWDVVDRGREASEETLVRDRGAQQKMD